METTTIEVYATIKRGQLSAAMTCRTTTMEHATMVIDALKQVDSVISIHLRTIRSKSTLAYEQAEELRE